MKGSSPCSYSSDTINEVREIKKKIEVYLSAMQ
jgi:hypothetical protein